MSAVAETIIPIRLAISGQGAVTAALSQVKGVASGIASTALKVAPGLATVASLGGAIAAVGVGLHKVIDEGGKLGDLAIRTGVSVRNLIRWREVFAESGKSAEAVGTTFDRVSRSIYEAANSGGPAQLALSKLGLSARELSALAPEDQFEKIAKAINGVVNPTERAAVTLSIFGKGAGDLLPVFDTMRDMSSVDGALGRLPEILGRNVKALDGIGDSFTQLPLKSQQFFAGVLEQVAPSVQGFLQQFTQIDLTAAGQKFGAFVNVAIDAWREGKFGEFVSLSIEAGLEQAGVAARSSFRSLSEYAGRGEFWRAVGVGLLTGINSGLKLAAEGITYLAVPFAAVGDYVRDVFVYAFTKAANAFGEAIKSTVNSAVEFLNDKLGTSFRTLTYTPKDAGSPSFSGSLERAIQARQDFLPGISSFFDNSTNAARALAGYSGDAGSTFEATNKLSGLIREMMERREKSAKAEEAAKLSMNAQIPIGNRINDLRQEELKTLRKLRGLEDQRAALTGSYLLTNAQKYSENLRLLTAQRMELERMVNALREQARLPGLSDQERTQISQRADTFDNKLSGVNKELGAVGPDPNSITQQMLAAGVELQNTFGTLAQNIANGFTNVIGTAVNSVSDGITGLIMGTKTWAGALREIGVTILTSVVHSIVQLGVRWIATQILMATVGKAILASSVAAAAPIAAASAAIWAAPATLATIATYGSAAAAAPAFITGAQAITTATSVGSALAGFAGGGYTGDGPRNEIAGVAHRGEVVFEAPVVDRIGLAPLMALRESASSGGTLAAPATQSGPVAIATFDSRVDARRWAETQESEAWVVDVVNRNVHRIRVR